MSINNWGSFNSWEEVTSTFNSIWYYTNLTGNNTMQKNVTGQKLVVFAFDRTTGVPFTGDSVNITANISKDNGASVAITDINPTETEGGYYSFDLTQAETNADVIQAFPSSTTTDIQVIATPAIIYTTPMSFADGVIQTADHTSNIVSILADTNELQSNQGNWLTATGFNTVAPDNASIAAILTDTSTTIPNQISSLNDLSVADVWNTQLTESYAADGVAPTATQSLMLTQQFLSDFDITGTSYNVKRLDGTNTAATFTLNDAANPTAITRS